MITKIKRYLLVSASTLMLAVSAFAPVAVNAASTGSGGGCKGISNDIAQGANATASGNNVDCTPSGAGGTDAIGTLARNVVNIFSFVVGAIAVIMIIYGGFRYITSGGDSNSVGSAKNTLIYAIIGLIIVALAQIIVSFVLTQTNEATT